MIDSIKQFFYKPGTTQIHKEKIISTIILLLGFIAFIVYRSFKNEKLQIDRKENARYTIGMTIKQGKNFRLPNPFVVYSFNLGAQSFEKTETIPDYLQGKIVTSGGRYYVQLSSKNPNNCKLLLEYPVPDSIDIAPSEGWDYMPGYLNNQ